jgi:hypothetical protein
MAARDAPAGRGQQLVCSCRAGTPARAAPAGWGHPPGGNSLADFGRSEREGDPLMIALASV